MYDELKDPYEWTNLAAKPEYAAKVTELMTILAAMQKEFGDTCALTVAHPKDPA